MSVSDAEASKVTVSPVSTGFGEIVKDAVGGKIAAARSAVASNRAVARAPAKSHAATPRRTRP